MRGGDYLVVRTVEGKELRQLGHGMIECERRIHKGNFDRCGENVLASQAVVLIGPKEAGVCSLDCGASSADVCDDINSHDGEFRGPSCALHLPDPGIALGSAVKIAGMLKVNHWIMHRAGALARWLGLIDAGAVMGVGLSA